MDHHAFVLKLAIVYEALAARNTVSRDKLEKKLILLKADAKCEPEILAAGTAKYDESMRIYVRTNVELFKMRALKNVYLKRAEVAGGEEKKDGGEEDDEDEDS